MKLVTTTCGLEKRFGVRKSVEMIKTAGFDGYDLNLFSAFIGNNHEIDCVDHISYAKELRRFADGLDIKCLQTHAPKSSVPAYGDLNLQRDITAHIKSLEVTSLLGSKYTVVHPIIGWSEEQNLTDFYSKLFPVAKDLGVTIATENMFIRDEENCSITPATCGTPEKFCEIIDNAPKGELVACLDIGHSELSGSLGAVAMIKALAGRIKCLHVHDNAQIDDDHTHPFQSSGKINWREVISALKEVNYNGNFTFESTQAFRRYPNELMQCGLNHLADIGRYFIKELTK